MTKTSIISDTLMREIRGRLRYATVDIEERINSKEKPEPKPWVYPSHPLDEEATHYGLKGFEFKTLQEAAVRETRHNAMLRKAYKDFLMLAKLVCEDALSVSREHEKKQAQMRVERETNYRRKSLAWEERANGMRTSWNKARATLRERWNHLITDLDDKIADPEKISSREAKLIESLAAQGALVIGKDHRVKANWSAAMALELEIMAQIMEDLDWSDISQ